MSRLLLILGLALAAPLAAQEQDYTPEFGAIDGAALTHFLSRRFDGYDFPAGQFTRDLKPVRRLEGAVRELVYRLDDDTSTLEAIRNYERALTELGYEIVFECAENDCGGFDFRFGVFLVDPPAMRFDLSDFRYLGAANETTLRYASIIASRQGGKLFIQVIDVAANSAPETMADVKDAPKPAAKPAGARLYALARRLTESGHAPLEGIAFEPGSAKLKVESNTALEQAAQLLKGRPDLRFLVVGHTDNEGALEANLRLSKARAASVAAALSSIDGIEAAQLEPHGVGFLAPRAPNDSADGRAQNRRVELVLQGP